jgi:hypothetical protein
MRCSIKRLLWVLLLVQSCLLQAVEIYVAPFVTASEDHLLELTREEKEFGGLFYRAVLSFDEEHFLTVRQLRESDLIKGREVTSLLAAGELCEKYNIDYLVYGFYKKTYQYSEAEIRVYERETKENKKVFYAKAEHGEINIMKDDLARKLVVYFYDLLGVDERERRKIPTKAFGGIEIYGGLGYWTPTGDWFGLVTGIAAAEVGVFIQPDDIILYDPDWLVLFRYGFTASYMLGLNKPDVEDAYLHSMQLDIPVRLCVLFLQQHMAYAGIGLFYRHDFVYQIRLFGSPVWSNSGTLGASSAVGYEYWCGESKLYAFGGELKLDAAFYEHPVVRLALLFTFKYRLDFDGGTESVRAENDDGGEAGSDADADAAGEAAPAADTEAAGEAGED